MPDRNTGKKFPFCEITVNGTCAAINKDAWADLIAIQGEEALNLGNKKEAGELFRNADRIRKEIRYCNNCPLRVK
jgi:hypothetical protein